MSLGKECVELFKKILSKPKLNSLSLSLIPVPIRDCVFAS